MAFSKFFRVFVVFLIVYLVPSVLFSDDIKEADKLFKQLNYRYALEIYEKVMKENPSSEVAEKIALCYRLMKNTEAAEVWYKKTLAYPEARTDNYKFLADALKQNGKYDEAAANYKIWGIKNTAYSSEADKQANICIVAKTWMENPDLGAVLQNEVGLNSENADYSPVKFGDDILFVSNRWQLGDKKDLGSVGADHAPLKIYVSNPAKKVSLLKGNFNDAFQNGTVAVYPSLDTLIFTRTVISDKKVNKVASVKQYLLKAVKKGKEWVVKDKLPFNDGNQFSVQHPALSPDGKTLYFASDMPGGWGGMDLYYSEKLADGSWSKPQNCGNQVNTPDDDVFPTVGTDGRFYFSSKDHLGMGGLDIFSAKGEKSNFTAIENMRAPLNSPKDDFGIMFNADGRTGYLSSSRNGGVGLADIYSFTLGVKADPKLQQQLLAVNGLVSELGTNVPIGGIEVLLINKNTKVETKAISDAQGKFSFSLDPEADYTVKGNPSQYFTSQSGEISTKGITQSTIYDIKFELERSKDVFTVKLNHIFYDFNQWYIRKDAYADLNKVSSFMSSMPNVRMELVSHTDARGSEIYNLKLSQKRAQTALTYLVDKGVASDRLVAIGKGESELLNECTDGVKCTEAQHQLNRRTEFKIVKVNPLLARSRSTK